MPKRMLRDDRRIVVRLVVAPLASLILCPFAFGGTTDQSPSETPQGLAELARVVEPPELKALSARSRIQPSAADVRLMGSKALKADPDHPETIAPALKDLNDVIALAPERSDFYLVRATLSCFNHAEPSSVVAGINKSIDLYRPGQSAYENLAGHYALRARVEFDTAHYADSLKDLDLAITQNYDNAADIFNDGKVEPSKSSRRCAWTQPDLDLLASKFPSDGRPLIYKGLYLSFFSRFHPENRSDAPLEAFNRAAELAPKSPLPHYYAGLLYVSGNIGGMMSKANSGCLYYVVPRTEACRALDQVHENGVRELTTALALDPNFAPAYEERAEAYLKLKQHAQAIRDYTDALRLESNQHETGILFNDRGLAKFNTGLYQSSVEDFTLAIKLLCNSDVEKQCDEYVNRANAYAKQKNFSSAGDDLSMAIRSHLGSSFIWGISQFRKIYPEYDGVRDDVLADSLRRRLYPQMTYPDFSKEFLIDAKGIDEFVIAELYCRRGDMYARMGNGADAKKEYDRVVRGFPESAKMYLAEHNGRWIRNQTPID
jgi:tetratricopeptide (TPR) repeat protein